MKNRTPEIIKGDIGTDSGELEFHTDVEIQGSVDTGARIKVHGDITVQGVLKGGAIYADNIYVEGRVVDGAFMQAKFNIRSVSIELSNACAGESIFVEEAILQSEVCAGKKVSAYRKIVGGIVRAGELVITKELGGKFPTPTRVQVGVPVEDAGVVGDLLGLVARLEQSLEECEKALRYIDASKSHIERREAEEMRKFYLTRRLRDARGRLKQLQGRFPPVVGAKVVAEEVLPGVEIVVGYARYFVDEKLERVLFINKNGEVCFERWAGDGLWQMELNSDQ